LPTPLDRAERAWDDERSWSDAVAGGYPPEWGDISPEAIDQAIDRLRELQGAARVAQQAYAEAIRAFPATTDLQ
jgi:hypothetical protein